MSNRLEHFVVGSEHEGAEGMFSVGEESPSLSPEQLHMARQERRIFTDAQERFETTVQTAGYEPVEMLGDVINYPTLDQWVEHRIAHQRGTKFFPSFVKDVKGKLFFCKAQLSEDPAALQGLDREAERLQNIPPGIHVPSLVKYIPPTDRGSALLITEALPPREAGVASSERWSNEHVADAVRQIKIIENAPITEPEIGDQKPRDIIADAQDLADRANLPSDLYDQIIDVIEDFRALAKPTYVHGDAALKNIMISTPGHEPAVFFC